MIIKRKYKPSGLKKTKNGNLSIQGMTILNIDSYSLYVVEKMLRTANLPSCGYMLFSTASMSDCLRSLTFMIFSSSVPSVIMR